MFHPNTTAHVVQITDSSEQTTKASGDIGILPFCLTSILIVAGYYWDVNRLFSSFYRSF
jgi:hypothetical protein